VSQEPAQAADFYARALDRIQKFMLALGVAALITAFGFFGLRTGMGFTLGAAIAYLNFYWLKKVVAGLGELTNPSGSESGRKIVHRFVLRYVLMAIVAFVILTVSRESLYGLFAGLFLPVTAMLCEAVYEVIRVISGW
jgi:ATP synthase I chain